MRSIFLRTPLQHVACGHSLWQSSILRPHCSTGRGEYTRFIEGTGVYRTVLGYVDSRRPNCRPAFRSLLPSQSVVVASMLRRRDWRSFFFWKACSSNADGTCVLASLCVALSVVVMPAWVLIRFSMCNEPSRSEYVGSLVVCVCVCLHACGVHACMLHARVRAFREDRATEHPPAGRAAAASTPRRASRRSFQAGRRLFTLCV